MLLSSTIWVVFKGNIKRQPGSQCYIPLDTLSVSSRKDKVTVGYYCSLTSACVYCAYKLTLQLLQPFEKFHFHFHFHNFQCFYSLILNDTFRVKATKSIDIQHIEKENMFSTSSHVFCFFLFNCIVISSLLYGQPIEIL